MQFTFVLLFSLFTIFSYAQHDITVYYEYTRDGYALYADSQETFPVIIEFEFELLNLKVVREGPSAIVIPPKSKRIKLVNLVAIKVLKGYNFKYTFKTTEDTRQVVSLDPVLSTGITVKTDSIVKEDRPLATDVDEASAGTKKEIRRIQRAKRKANVDSEIAAMAETSTKPDKVIKPEVLQKPDPVLKPATAAEPVVTSSPVISSNVIDAKSPDKANTNPEAVSGLELRAEPITSVIPEVETLPDLEEQPVTSVIPEVETVPELEEQPITSVILEVETLPDLEEQPITSVIPEVESVPEVEEQPITSVIPEVETVPVVKEQPVALIIPELKTVSAEMAKSATIIDTSKPPLIPIPLKPIVKYPASGKHDAAFMYFLPFKKGENYLVSQGYQGKVSHQNKFALDFAMPVGTEIYAARDGIVSEVVQNNSRGCESIDCAKYENYILINHSDGSFARYAHIKENGAVVKPGELVGIGQLIGFSGDTGRTTEASLHFEVFIRKASVEKSLKTNFLLGDGTDYGILFPQQSYSRKY